MVNVHNMAAPGGWGELLWFCSRPAETPQGGQLASAPGGPRTQPTSCPRAAPPGGPQGHAKELACCLASQSMKGSEPQTERGLWPLLLSVQGQRVPQKRCQNSVIHCFQEGDPWLPVTAFQDRLPGPRGQVSGLIISHA